MKEDVVIRLDRPGLHPDGVSASSLAELLRDWEKAVSAEAAFDDDQDNTNDPLVSLVWIKDECAAYGLKFGRNAVAANRRLLDGLASGGGDPWASLAPVAQESITRLIRRFTVEETSFTLESGVSARLTFTSDHPPPLVDRRRFAEAPTTRSVRVVKAGGVRPAATVELIGGGYRIPVQGNRRLIQSLGSSLYQRVLLKGKAQWRLSDWKLILFKAEEIRPYPDTPIADVLQSVAAASGETWSKGVPGFLAEMRDDDEDEE